jgi:hypothetical protein
MNTNKIPRVAPTPDDSFYFEVAPQIIEEKDRIISQLHDELQELREYILEQRQQTIHRNIILHELTRVVEDIVALYPRFVDNDINCENMALAKGYEHANNIVTYIDKFKNSARILQCIKTELQSITIENASYKKMDGGTTMIICCETLSSIIGFNSIDNRVHHPYSYLCNAMNNIIIETLKFGHWKRDGSRGNFVFYKIRDGSKDDGIHYKSNEEHAQIWEWKKTFAKRMVRELLIYVEYLLRIILSKENTQSDIKQL